MNDKEQLHPSQPAGVHLCMPETARKVVAHRLAIARGHLESILHSLQKHDAYCVDVLRQIKAVQGALEKAGQITLESHLRVHVATAADRGDTEAIVEELMDALRYR
ncbi:MAG: metal-sensitive transcriptional regulator [Betaproteobacteria bacterium]|nr:metal-sensitive transcriptional regulator [Betaproteobacteria bacterium]MBI3938155.1 metal-sensitive transcriptional regulator [Betaproteobacteria bacterium]